MCGTDVPTYHRERPGMSAFVLDNGVVCHIYFTYARGVDAIWGMYAWLDCAPIVRRRSVWLKLSMAVLRKRSGQQRSLRGG